MAIQISNIFERPINSSKNIQYKFQYKTHNINFTVHDMFFGLVQLCKFDMSPMPQALKIWIIKIITIFN